MIATEPSCSLLVRRVVREAGRPLIVAEIRAGVERERAIDTKNPDLEERVILKALAREPQDGFVSAGAMAMALHQAVNGVDERDSGLCCLSLHSLIFATPYRPMVLPLS